MSIPHLFRCPISLDLFTDPVTLSTGQTYDRPSIEKWFADGHLTCPVTMQHLDDTTLTPNHTLRHLIYQWLLAGSATNDDSPLPSSAVDSAVFSLLALRQTLQSSSAWCAEKMLESAKKVKDVCAESEIARAYLIQLGFFPLLLRLLFLPEGAAADEPAPAGVVLDCVLSLAASCPLEPLNMLMEDASLASFELLFHHGDVKIKIGLCRLLEAISSSPATQELSLIVGRSQRILQVLLSLLHDKSCVEASEAAVRATAGLCVLEPNRCHAIREGVVDGLIANLSNCGSRQNASRALATLEKLLESDAGRRALVENPEGVEAVVRMVFRVSAADQCAGSEHALGVLLAACRELEKARWAAVEAGVMLQVVLLLQSQCSGKAKGRGRALLKLLRTTMWGGRRLEHGDVG